MTAAVIVLAVAVLVLAVTTAYLLHRNRLGVAAIQEARRQLSESGHRKLLGRRVVVQLSDRSVRGVLKETYEDGHLLAHPELLAGAQPAAMGGEYFAPAGEVRGIQVFEDAPPRDPTKPQA